jgi:hypothetical protein
MKKRLQNSVLLLVIVVSVGLAARLLVGNTELASMGVFGYLLKLVLLGWWVFGLLFTVVLLIGHIIDYVCEHAGVYRACERLGIGTPRIKNASQVDQLSIEAWFQLSYDQRIETVRLLLQREYPEQYSTYSWIVLVLVEDAMWRQLRQWQEARGAHFTPVSGAMLIAVGQVGDRIYREGFTWSDELIQVCEIYQSKGWCKSIAESMAKDFKEAGLVG